MLIENAEELVDLESTKNLSDLDTLDDYVTNGLTLNIGETLYLKVEENPTTGFNWQIDDDCAEFVDIVGQYVDPLVEPVDESTPTILGGDSIEIVGRPGYKVLEFEPKAEGVCTFKIALARSWEFEFDNPDKQVYDDLIQFPTFIG